MHRELLKIGPVTIFSYGALLAIGLIVALLLAKKRAPKYQIPPDGVFDSSLVAVILGIFGARITFIAQDWQYFSTHPNDLWSLQFSGLTSFGGVVFGLLGLFIWSKFAKKPFLGILDVFGAPFLVAHAIGRIGCLLNGCCYGRVCNAWYCVPGEASRVGMHFFPAQLLDTAFNLVGFAVLIALEKRGTFRLGQSFGISMALHGLARFFYEFWRSGTVADVKAGLASSTLIPGLPITEGHVAAAVLIVIGIIVYAVNRKQPLPGETTSSS